MTLVYKDLGIFPFKDKCLLPYWDIREQYSNYFEYLRTIFNGDNDFMYSFSKTLGGDIIGLAAYYFCSPLNIVFGIFKNAEIVDIILFLTLLRIGLCGLTFFIYLNHKKKFDVKSLIFSSSYALMAYNIVYQQNPMWIDGVVLLPVICMGIDNFIENGKFQLYVLSLSLAIFSNYYIGWILGIFSFLYFFYKLILAPKKEHAFKKSIVPFTLYSILSIGITGCLLVPTLFSLSGGKGPLSYGVEWLFDFHFYFHETFFTKLCPGAFLWDDLMGGEPLIFCGLLCNIFFVIYFLNKGITVKERVTSLVLMCFFVLTFYNSFLNTIWHGLNPPTGFPYRNAFLFSFMLISLAYKGFCNFESNVKFYFIVLTCAVLTIVSHFTMRIYYASFSEKVQNYIIYGMILFTVFCLSMYLKFWSIKKISVIILAVLVSYDLFNNAYESLSKYNFIDHDDMSNFSNSLRAVVAETKNLDSDFYRIEKTFSRTRNDNMLLDIPGISHYSSSEKNDVKYLMGGLGYDQYYDVYCAYGKGSTNTADSLLGIRYLISTQDLEKERSYIPVKQVDGKTIYKNPYALTIGTVVNSSVLDKNIIDDDRIKFQNHVFNHMTGLNNDVIKKMEDVKVEYNNIEIIDNGMVKLLRKKNDKKKASIVYTFKGKGNNIYLDAWSQEPSNVSIFLNDESMENLFNGNRVNLKKLPVCDDYKLEIQINTYRVAVNSLELYYEDNESLMEHSNYLRQNKCEIKKQTSSKLVGKVSVNEDNKYVLLSIPYETTWKIKVDGKPVEPKKVFYDLITFPIEKGDHDIELVYRPKGLYLGIFLSISSFLIFVFLRYKQKHKIISSV